jgi:hypothetical protein
VQPRKPQGGPLGVGQHGLRPCELQKDEFDDVCNICGEVGELLCCEGGCFTAYHLDCIGLACEPEGKLRPAAGVFLPWPAVVALCACFALSGLSATSGWPLGTFCCDACATGTHSGYACDQSGGALVQCSEPGCCKRYHPGCAAALPRTECVHRAPCQEGGGGGCPMLFAMAAVVGLVGVRRSTAKPRPSSARCTRAPTAMWALAWATRWCGARAVQLPTMRSASLRDAMACT